MPRHALMLFAVLLGQALPARAQKNAFSLQTHYTQQVVSVAPLRIAYTLTGTGRHAPVDFNALRLSGEAVLVFAYADSVVQVHASPLQVAPDQRAYHWTYPAWSAPGATIAAIHGVDREGFAASFEHGSSGRWPLRMRFVVGFDPAVDYDPARVNLQVVYLKSGPIAPHIDVFTAVP